MSENLPLDAATPTIEVIGSSATEVPAIKTTVETHESVNQLPCTKVEVIAALGGEAIGITTIVYDNMEVFQIPLRRHDQHIQQTLKAQISAEQKNITLSERQEINLQRMTAARRAQLHSLVETRPQPLGFVGSTEQALGVLGGIVVAPLAFGIAASFLHRSIRKYRAK
jgi:hypothetical protein